MGWPVGPKTISSFREPCASAAGAESNAQIASTVIAQLPRAKFVVSFIALPFLYSLRLQLAARGL
jgi:hypothetical protein